MKPWFCLIFHSTKRKGMPVSPSIWLRGVCYFMPWQLDNRKARNSLCFCLSSASNWKNCTSHHISWKPDRKKREEWQRAVPIGQLVCWDGDASVSFRVPTVWHLTTCGHFDSSPMTLPFSKLKSLCTSLTMHSVTSWLAGMPAAVNWLVLDCVQPHRLCCDLKAYLH